METTTCILLLAVLTSTAAVTSAYPVPYSSFLPYTYSSFGVPRTLPLRPAFNYAYQATAPSSAPFAPLFSPADPASSVARVIYSEGALMTPSNVMLRGFAYQTRYTNGGHSEVTFVTGPGSKELMEQHLEFFRNLLLPAPRAANSSETGNTSLDATTTPNYASVLNSAPFSNLQQSSGYTLLPAHTSPLLQNPVDLHNMINYFQTLGNSPFTNLDEAKESGDDNAEAQESMINVLGRILAPAESSNDISQSNSSPEESNSIDDVSSSSSAPDTTQASTSESNSPNTEQVSTDNSVASSNVISSPQSQESETPASEQIRSSTEQASASTEQASASTEQASASTEQASPSTEQASASTEQASPSTEQASPSTEQASPSTEQASASTEQASSSTDIPVTPSEASPSSETENETTTAAQSSSEQNETTNTEATAAETTTQDDDTDLAESA
ncbi:Uncharacterized protein GBIM_18531 [Gryllus bimaculatus]|nr:Uncharacterized protein GBIM_18531 [Gryllus bimaculatus]